MAGMATWVALLRGVNVGRSARLSMADLRRVLGSLGASEVETHLQSGNAVFTCTAAAAALERDIACALRSEFDMNVKVLVRSARDLAAAAAGNPFPEAATDPKTLHVAFLSGPPPAGAVAGIDRARFAPDEFVVKGKLVYVHLPDGFARTKLTNDMWERSLKVTSTMRNWNTVTKLAELAGG